MNARTLGKVQVGDQIPDFEAYTDNGDLINVEVLTGYKNIIYFYPKDDTPGCTKQACNLRDNYAFFIKKGYRLFGVSKDSVARHQKFKTKYELPFPLIADPELVMLNAFGFHGPKKFMGKESMGTYRTTVVTDEYAVITHIIYDVNTADHTNQLRTVLGV